MLPNVTYVPLSPSSGAMGTLVSSLSYRRGCGGPFPIVSKIEQNLALSVYIRKRYAMGGENGIQGIGKAKGDGVAKC